jgi:hypothetical protein
LGWRTAYTYTWGSGNSSKSMESNQYPASLSQTPTAGA